MSGNSFSFGEYRLDTARRELWRGDELVALPTKVFDCIAYLAEHRDRAVGRDELIAAVWGRTDVTDNLLDQIMLRARRAVGDVNGERHVIRTIPRFGFNWVAPTDTSASPAEPANAPGEVVTASGPGPKDTDAARARADASSTSEPAIPHASKQHYRWLAPIVLVTLLAAAAGSYQFTKAPVAVESGTSAAATQANAVLVLPVTVQAGNEFAWVRLGVMDFIATRLRMAGLTVVPSDTTVAIAQGSDPQELDDAEIEALARSSAATLILDAQAETTPAGWRVRLRTRLGHTPALTSEGEAKTVLDATRLAADRMSLALDLVPPVDQEHEPETDELIQQATATMLANHLDEARVLLDKASANPATLPEVEYLKGRLELIAGNYAAARELFAALIDHVSEADDPVLRGRGLYGIAFTYLRDGDEEAAARYFDASVAVLERSRASEAASALGRVLTLRGANQHMLLKPEAAQRDFARARVLLETAGDQIGLVALDNNAGIFAVDQDRYTEAIPFLERAVQRALATHDVASELRARIGIVRARLGLLEPEAALVDDTRLRELADRVAEPDLRRFVGAWRANALAASGQLTAANDVLREVRDEPAESSAGVTSLAYTLQARLALEDARFVEAAQLASRVSRLAWDDGDPRQRGLAWITLLRSQLALGKLPEAAATVSGAQAWAKRVGVPPTHLYARLAEAEQAAALGDAATAKEAFRQAWSIAERRGVPFDLLRAAECYLAWLIRTDDLTTASIITARMTGWAARDYGAALVQLRLYHALGEPTAWASALAQARRLAGERRIPDGLLAAPGLPVKETQRSL
jgi:DNA-binding winged helix-turn-helix (wHTH) protein/tetratricopeptide (TPR) repeat protein